jgi:hypothetical protein
MLGPCLHSTTLRFINHVLGKLPYFSAYLADEAKDGTYPIIENNIVLMLQSDLWGRIRVCSSEKKEVVAALHAGNRPTANEPSIYCKVITSPWVTNL